MAIKKSKRMEKISGHPLADFFAAYFLNDESGDYAFDMSGNGYKAFLQNAAYWTPNGYYGYGVNLNGINAFLSIIDADIFSPMLTPLSVSAYIYMRDATRFNIAVKGKLFTDGEWSFGTMSNDKVQFQVHDESEPNGYRSRNYDTPLTDLENSWIHLLGTYDGDIYSSGIKIYLNGVQVDDTDNTGSGTFVSVENLGEPTLIGKNDYPDTFYADGIIDNVIFYNRELNLQDSIWLRDNSIRMLKHIRKKRAKFQSHIAA